MKAKYLIFILVVMLAGGCAKKQPASVLVPPAVSLAIPLTLVTGSGIPPLADDLDAGSLDLAISRSLKYLDRGVAGRYRFGDREVSSADIRESLLAFREILRSPEGPDGRMQKILDGFDIYRAAGSDGAGTVVFTGYYAPVIDGSLQRTERFQHPLYRPPEELAAGKRTAGSGGSYLSRADIDTGKALAGRNLEIAWVEDPVALFFLHIQGSGLIRLPDGRLIRVSYARHNGRAYGKIADYMVARGFLPRNNLSNQAIQKYLREHPDRQAEIFNYNERYIFFRIVEDGAIGSLGVPVTGGRSIAADPAVFPRGALAFIRLRKPAFDLDNRNTGWSPFSRFVLSQDEGDAIKGPGRIDLYCGEGDEGGRFASILKEKGELYFLVKKRVP